MRSLGDLSESRIFQVLESLSTIYCPDVASVAHKLNPSEDQPVGQANASLFVDSGYTSATEDAEDEKSENAATAAEKLYVLRADEYERGVAERWLTGFIGRAEELACFETEDARQRALDEASYVLESFYATPTAEDPIDEEYARDFAFTLSVPGKEQSSVPVTVRLNDGLAGTNSQDPDDVGLQSWSASIVLSDLMCADPERFGLTTSAIETQSPRIIELGAGTGLVGLVLGTALPHLGFTDPKVIATDYHPAVLANLRDNITTNFGAVARDSPVEACLLDWSAPSREVPLHLPADMLIATDVVYAHEHAVWLRDCASQLLAPHGVFWLLITVRQKGHFEDVHVCETVEKAFTAADRPQDAAGRLLSIRRSERLDKCAGLGRGDESGYQLFMIGWE